jgi:hypothetical protein
MSGMFCYDMHPCCDNDTWSNDKKNYKMRNRNYCCPVTSEIEDFIGIFMNSDTLSDW